MKATLSNWSLTQRGVPAGVAPECSAVALQGTVTGHPRHADGKRILTSTPTGRTADGEVVTRNTTYTLGDVDPAYEAAFPGARRRVLDSLPLV